MQDAKRQVEYLISQGAGPANPEATALMSDAQKRFDPLQPEHVSVQVAQNQGWWADNYDDALNRYLAAIGA